MVGEGGLEPPASASRTLRATKLRHSPAEFIVASGPRSDKYSGRLPSAGPARRPASAGSGRGAAAVVPGWGRAGRVLNVVRPLSSRARSGSAVYRDRRAAFGGTVLILVSAAGFGAMSIFAKAAYAAGANVPTTLFLRFVLASFVLWSGLVATHRVPAALAGGPFAACVALGAIGYAGMSLVFFSALLYVPASLAALILYTYPPIVTVLAFLWLREALDGRKCLALGIASFGLVLVLGLGAGAARTAGVILALAAVVAYSLYIISARFVLRGVAPLSAAAIVIPAAGAVFGVYGAASGTLHLSLALSAYAAIAGMAVISTVLAIVAFFAGLERVGASRAAILSTFEPVVTLTLAATTLGERLVPVQLIGGAFILSAVLLLHAGEPAEPSATVPAIVPDHDAL